jgi:hypothetical protein
MFSLNSHEIFVDLWRGHVGDTHMETGKRLSGREENFGNLVNRGRVLMLSDGLRYAHLVASSVVANKVIV